ncbi:hypothetical protein TNCV_4325081 [Trichonephila clavipes]|nr:hypothetical protein TNCV_4325081 [Trichonephila clavipes]
MAGPSKRPTGTPRPKDEILKHAKHFFDQYFSSIKRVPELGLGVVGKIKFRESFRIVRAQVPPTGEKTGRQNYIAVIRIPPTWYHLKVIQDPGECNRSAMVNTNPQPHWKF